MQLRRHAAGTPDCEAGPAPSGAHFGFGAIGSPGVTERQPIIPGLWSAGVPTHWGKTPSGLIVPAAPSSAGVPGLVAARDAWLDDATATYLTARDYIAPWEAAYGRAYDSLAWTDALLRLYPAEVYVDVLAALNRATRFRDPVQEYQRRFLERLPSSLRAAAELAIGGLADGQQRWFLARQPLLRAMRLALTAPPPQGDPDPRIAEFLAPADHLVAAALLAHLAADGLSGQQAASEERFGGTSKSLAIEIVCNQIFNEPHDAGGVIARTWALWTRHAAGLSRAQLPKPPVDLLQDATGLVLEEILAIGFACWAMTIADRVDGLVRINPFTVVNLSHETVERFLALFSARPSELAQALQASAQPWQMLPLQSRPLLRVADDAVVVLDEPFLLEAITTGLYWRVSDHVRQGDPEAWRPWAVAYAEMTEDLAEELIRALAPTRGDGSSAFFTEEDIKAAFTEKRGAIPRNADAGVDFGDSVALFEIVNKNMSLQARSGDIEAFETDVDQAVLIKAKQLDGTAALLQRSPQPADSPLGAPAATVFPIVVCGNHFPNNPVTRNYIEERLGNAGLLQAPGIRRLAVIDLDELESCVSLADAGVLLPKLLSEWLASPYGKGSLTVYLWATYGGSQMERPQVTADDLREVMNAIMPLLNPQDEASEPTPDPAPADDAQA
jgi:hypothetical protein